MTQKTEIPTTMEDKAKYNEGDEPTGWVKCDERLPNQRGRVLAIYQGVYEHRVVTFWRDGGGNPHFGYPESNPATHWHPLPELP